MSESREDMQDKQDSNSGAGKEIAATAVAAAALTNEEEKEDLDEDMLEEIRVKSEAAIAALKEEK